MSKKPVLWLTRKLTENSEARASRDYEVILNHEDQVATPEKLIEMSRKVDAILPCHSELFSAEVVAQLGDRLKIVANHSVGVDHCDLIAFKSRGIVVTNTPDVLSDATAEVAMLLMLGAARRAAEGDHLVRSGDWTSWSPAFMVGRQMTGKRIGILGMGKVGQVMAERAKGFNMQVHYHNRQRLDATREAGASYHKTVESLLSVSDFLSLHCPATSETKGIINDQTLAMLPDGAIVVNTARGALIDEEALLRAVKSCKLAAVGLDCFVNEPLGNPRFASYYNIFMLPHIGSATFETRDAMGFRALDNLDAYFSGGTPVDRLV